MADQEPITEPTANAQASERRLKKQQNKYTCPALLVARYRDGKAIRFGSIVKGKNTSAKLEYIYKISADADSFQGMRLTLQRKDDEHQRYSCRMDAVRIVWKFTAGKYWECHLCPEEEFVLQDTLNDEDVREVYNNKDPNKRKIFWVKLSTGDPSSIEVAGRDAVAALKDEEAEEARKLFDGIEAAALSLYMIPHSGLEKDVDRLVEMQKTFLNPFKQAMQHCVKNGVEWGQIQDIPPLEGNKKVEPCLHYTSLEEFNFIQGHAERFEALYKVKLVCELRNLPIEAHFVKAPSATNEMIYLAFCKVPNFPRFAKLFHASMSLVFTPFGPPPRLTRQDREAGKNQEKDNLPGFPAHVILGVRDGVFSNAPLVLMVRRPKDGPMSAYPIKFSETQGARLEPTAGYLKIRYDDTTIKGTLKELAKLLPQNQPDACLKELALGLSFTDKTEINLLKDLTKEQCQELESRLLGSQKDCFRHHLTRVRQKVCLILGPPGTGKTYFAAVLCEAFAWQNQRTLISTTTNAAADAAAAKFADSTLRVVRVVPIATIHQAVFKEYEIARANVTAKQLAGAVTRINDRLPPLTILPRDAALK